MTKESLKNYLLNENNNGDAWGLLVEIGLELSGTDSFPEELSYKKTLDEDIFINENDEEIYYMEYANLLYDKIDIVIDSLIEEAEKAHSYFKNISTDMEFNYILDKLIKKIIKILTSCLKLYAGCFIFY